MPARSFEVGKIPPEALVRIVYSHVGRRNPRLLIGPGIGRDIAAARYDPILILTTDPITGTSTRIGEHSVEVNANDIATAGAKPVWYMCTILLPAVSSQISVVKEALTIAKVPGVRLIHDPTEGGILNASWELGEASHLGVEVWADKIPVAKETLMICSRLRLDPLKLMSSGCLLTVVDPRHVDRVVKALRKLRVGASLIGTITPIAEGRHYSINGEKSDLQPVPQDEL